jgi:hypothetical protein
MPFTRGNIQQSGFEIVLSNFEAFENKFYDVLYPDIFWRQVIPQGSIDTTIPPGATIASYGVRDMTGMGAFDVSMSGAIPTVGMSVSKPATIPILAASVGASLSREDIRVYDYALSGKLDTELSAIMKLAAERHVEGVFFYGNADVGFNGWMDEPNVTTVQAFLNAATTSRKWADKTPDEILKDINTFMGKIFTDSIQVHNPGSVFIPTAQFVDIATRRMGILETSITVLQYIKEKNLYTVQTGQELEIKAIPHLAGAGAGPSDRMVILENKAENQKLPFPIPYNFLAPVQFLRDIHLGAEYKFGPYHNRHPVSMLYVDEI